MLCKAATDGTHTLIIENDDDPINPRVDYDNFGKMVCFHKRYSLGDKHDYREPRDFLADLLSDPRYAKPVYDYIRSARAKGVKLEYARSEHEWQLLSYEDYLKKWYIEASFPPGLKSSTLPSDFLDAAIEALTYSAMLEILNDSTDFVMLPLYLYDHSGITMNTSGFSCPWDSGQLGWIYADHAMIDKEYSISHGALTRTILMISCRKPASSFKDN